MNEGNILYSKKNQDYFIKLAGDLRFSLSRKFDTLLNMIFSDPEMQNIMVDMSEAKYIDSTILGMLAKIANFMIKKFQKRAVILSTNDNINYLLENIGLDKVFIIVDNSEDFPKSLKKMPDINSSEQENAITILNAHRQLMKINPNNRKVFKGVVDLLKEEIKQKFN